MARKRDVVIAFNPSAGASDTLDAARALASDLDALGFRCFLESNLATIRKHAADMADSLRCVVAAGGDGTIGLLVNELPPQTPFALLPQGTENLLAKFVNSPFLPSKVAEMIVGGRLAQLDAGDANGKLFLVMASCGFDARVVHQVHSDRRGHIRHWSYFKPIMDSIRKYRYPELTVQFPGSELESQRLRWAFMFNAPRYAMGLPIAEKADAMDGQLDLCGFKGGNLVNGLMYLAGIVLRQHHRWRDTVECRFSHLRVESTDEVPYQLDGDPGGFLPLELKAVPQRVNLLVPRTWNRPCTFVDGEAPNEQ